MLKQVITILLLVTTASAYAYYNLPASGQASARLINQRVFGPNTELGPFDLDGAHHYAKMDGNTLVLDQTGLYYIYGQVHYIHQNSPGQLYNRCQLQINNKPFRFLQKGMDGRADIGNVYSGGLSMLYRGDKIRLITQKRSFINMNPRVTFFGAFRVGFGCDECSHHPIPLSRDAVKKNK